MLRSPILLIAYFATFIAIINAEGYLCPYSAIGYDGSANKLLYDYYDTSADGAYYTRKGETGWQSPEEYCRQKGDLSIHSDAGEWKCNDSKGICNWSGSDCFFVESRTPDCLPLCAAIIDGEGPSCLGNCPEGSRSNTLYDRYCSNEINETKTTDSARQRARTRTRKRKTRKTRRPKATPANSSSC